MREPVAGGSIVHPEMQKAGLCDRGREQAERHQGVCGEVRDGCITKGLNATSREGFAVPRAKERTDVLAGGEEGQGGRVSGVREDSCGWSMANG